MIRYSVLGSGSSGNSYMLSTQGFAILLDAGFSLREIRGRVERAGMCFDEINALFITHLHPDHSRGAGVFARQTRKPVYVHRKLVEDREPQLEKLGIPEVLLHTFDAHEPEEIGPFSILAFPTSHDSPHAVGFTIRADGTIVTLLTDTGRVTDEMHRIALSSDLLFLEANYDVPMLQSGPYPPVLKKRISGDRGHLSNDEAIALLNNNCSGSTDRHVCFCHLSLVNNHPGLLESACRARLRWNGDRVICANGAIHTGTLATGVIKE